MLTKSMIVLSAVLVVGTAPAAFAMQHPAKQKTGGSQLVQRQAVAPAQPTLNKGARPFTAAEQHLFERTSRITSY